MADRPGTFGDRAAVNVEPDVCSICQVLEKRRSADTASDVQHAIVVLEDAEFDAPLHVLAPISQVPGVLAICWFVALFKLSSSRSSSVGAVAATSLSDVRESVALGRDRYHLVVLASRANALQEYRMVGESIAATTVARNRWDRLQHSPPSAHNVDGHRSPGRPSQPCPRHRTR
jgi:hypothetical protein